jgi:GntR family transcriptional regulator/MocR family aminotransferase
VAQGYLRTRVGGETVGAGPRAVGSSKGHGVAFPQVDLRSGAEQLAFAELIRSGRLDRHLRRMRTVFRRRRDRFLTALEAGVPHLPVHRITAGLHFLVRLPDSGPDESRVLDVAQRSGIALYGLRRCWHGSPRSQGIIVGFGRPPEHAVDDAIHGLVRVLDTATRPVHEEMR